jgi:predicted hotdog family 3-hydroxylacyl-ACP dehydratase
MTDECECEYDDAGFTLYQCEICHDAEQDARCTCVQDHINPNCQECY